MVKHLRGKMGKASYITWKLGCMFDFENLLGEFQNWLSRDFLIQMLHFILWVIFIIFLTWLARKGINRTISDNTMRYRARKVARLLSYALIILLAVITFTSKVQYFTIAIGLMSAGIAFALQEVILSFAGWVAIFTTKLYKPGDRIEMAGVKGDVIDIGITRTTMMEIGVWITGDNYNGRIVQMSNGNVFKGPIHNYSTDFPFVWDEIKLPLTFDSDIELAQQILTEIGEKHLTDYARYAEEHWQRMVRKYLIENIHVEPTLTVKLTDNWIEITLRYVTDYQRRRSTKHTLDLEILKAFQATEGKVKFASATFELVGMPELRVNLRTNQEG